MKRLLPLGSTVLLLTTACGESAPSAETGIFFATKPHRENVSMTALFEGPLVVRDGCVLIGGAGTYSLPIWNNGSTLSRDGSGRLVVRDDGTHEVAVEGEVFQMGGGYVAEFEPRDKVEPRARQIRRVEDWLGYRIPERCLGPDVYGIWDVGET
jgi:hypothetical protein